MKVTKNNDQKKPVRLKKSEIKFEVMNALYIMLLWYVATSPDWDIMAGSYGEERRKHHYKGELVPIK
jgi:hypothetical protein